MFHSTFSELTLYPQRRSYAAAYRDKSKCLGHSPEEDQRREIQSTANRAPVGGGKNDEIREMGEE